MSGHTDYPEGSVKYVDRQLSVSEVFLTPQHYDNIRGL